MLYSVTHILSDIKVHLDEKKPFSLVRLGDGDLKLLDALVKGRPNQIKFNRSGIPNDKVKWLLKLYKRSCNKANYTSSFEMYNTNEFWNRKFSTGTSKKVSRWEELYKRVGIVNENYCNPEVGFLLFLQGEDNLLKLIKGKRICLITCFQRPEKNLKKKGFDVTTIQIPSIGSGHYDKYQETISKIRDMIDDIDIFLIGAGALGKGYSYVIKNNGGISIDIGQVMNVWNGNRVPDRCKGILNPVRKNMLFKLTKKGQKYEANL